ncbi:MAG: hypothetical protein M3P40_09050 [Actinomycetota bacterium]|nr:hypothetical protein [Actinomycetota bacterium]
MRTTILVLANQTASSDDLLAALEQRSSATALRIEFVVPPSGAGATCRAQAEERLQLALARAREAGIEATGHVGDCDAFEAVVEAYDPARHDEIIISTLPASISHWLGIDLPARTARATNALVSHITASEPRPALR